VKNRDPLVPLYIVLNDASDVTFPISEDPVGDELITSQSVPL